MIFHLIQKQPQPHGQRMGEKAATETWDQTHTLSIQCYLHLTPPPSFSTDSAPQKKLAQ